MSRTGVFVVVACLGFPAFAQVRTWVSPNGLDTNPCSLQEPCRNFAAAITAVDSGGEVVALSSGGYGPVVVSSSVALISPEGVHAAIAPTSNTAIAIAAADSDRVVLRHIYLNSQGGAVGIGFVSGGALYVENCTVANFTNDGISFAPLTGGQLYVNDTTIRQNGAVGLFIDGGTDPADLLVSADQVRMQGNATGLFADSASVTIRRSEFTGNSVNGVTTSNAAVVVIEDSVSAGNGSHGIITSGAGSMTTLSRCAVSNNGVGVRSIDSGVALVSDCSITLNDQGLESVTGGLVRTRVNNTFQANISPGNFNNTYPAN